MGKREAWKKFENDFNAMTDEQIADESRSARDRINDDEEWLEAVAAWEGSGRPRKPALSAQDGEAGR